MKAAVARKPLIRVAVVETDPLRLVGFRALFDSESGFELIAESVCDFATLADIDVVLLGNCNSQNLSDLMATLKASRPGLRIIVTGSGMDEETILKVIASVFGNCWRASPAGKLLLKPLPMLRTSWVLKARTLHWFATI